MIVLRFGKTGRLAKICETATKLVFTSATFFNVNRAGEFVAEHDVTCQTKYSTIEALLCAHKQEKLILVDASIDHSSIENMVIHEVFKRNLIDKLNEQKALFKAIGFSSGITLIDSNRIRTSAIHMREYRIQKIEQEVLFESIHCPVFIPNIFTLIGPITYTTQGAAWAQILKARVERSSGIILNEPNSKKGWTSEFKIFRSLINFLATDSPLSTQGPLLCGDFSLSEIAKCSFSNFPELHYKIGNVEGWLDGDYLPGTLSIEKLSLTDELTRTLFMQIDL